MKIFKQAWHKLQNTAMAACTLNYTAEVNHVQELKNMPTKLEQINDTYEALESITEGFESNNQAKLALNMENTVMSAEMKMIQNIQENIQNRKNIHQSRLTKNCE